ncbi:hypothetical protein A3E15_00725 [Candidatus Woesebacteria bacterium RIFCSPHIGHO2_12_FULL_42_9]|uniref:PDZ domain-containing protein n=1 Tax=Candidatus Woesebacteria bacterium RIFCSPHIGHO2_12_FULL_42_9 TaxID=1802511 RepID=A0A1F8APR3_9BACT|nr:MAG: hypothetical protein A3E15_00725 [Candidatus Woesebacteria bacterium RIFCSPHIGHO2_12_FULL_42_9]
MEPNSPLPKINFTLIRYLILALIVLAATFSAGYLLGFKGYQGSLAEFPKVTITRELPQDKKDLDFSLFWRVWDTINTSYFDKEKVIPANMVYGAIEGMVSALGDPYTVFLPPDKNRVVQEDLLGSFDGIGIQIGFKGNQLAVIAPLPNSPSEKAGIEAGDFIVGIKDEAKGIERGTVGISITDAVSAIRGPAGTIVTLTLLREGQEEPIVVDVVRESIDVPSVTLTFVGDDENIAQVRLLKFGGETEAEWEEAVIEILKKQSLKGIVLDLRNNPGGYLQGAVDIASEFMKTGRVVVIEERGEQKSEYVVEKIGRFPNTPLVVLVNQGSASASEILAGALRDDKKVKLVGEKTFGKGTIQEPQQVDGGAGLHITVARWLTPSGVWVDGEGLTPDFELEDNGETDEDEQLQKGIELLQ